MFHTLLDSTYTLYFNNQASSSHRRSSRRRESLDNASYIIVQELSWLPSGTIVCDFANITCNSLVTGHSEPHNANLQPPAYLHPALFLPQKLHSFQQHRPTHNRHNAHVTAS